MMKTIFLPVKAAILVLTLFIGLNANAQTEFWGMTNGGGAYNTGTIFKTDGSGNNQQVVEAFFKIDGLSPRGSLMEATNGKLYGMTSQGGANSKGVLFEYDQTTNTYTKKFEFDGTNGQSPTGSLMEAANGKLYGMTPGGGANAKGVLFEYDPTTNTTTKKLDFDGTTNGESPFGSLMEAANGKLYGLTYNGGANNKGVLFEYDPTTNTYTKKIDFDGATNGQYPNGSLMEAANGKLYGMTPFGGANSNGVLFEYNPTTNTTTKKLDFNAATNGARPQGSLMEATNGKLYGMTEFGGANAKGVLFEYDPTTNTTTKKFDFDGTTNGANPRGSLMEAANGKLYGMTYGGGANAKGVLFEYDPTTNITTNKLDFDGTTNGQNPFGSLMEAANGKLYGMNPGFIGFGPATIGVLFEYDPATSTTTKKLDFNLATNGRTPNGSLMRATNGKLYGMTYGGGANAKGVLFEYNPTTSTYTNKFDFDGTTNGKNPRGSLMEAANGKLYGMTSSGGANNSGVLFEYDPTTNTYTKKIDFDGTTNGQTPEGSLMEATNGKLYGMNQYGGANNKGVLFEYDPTTNTYTKKIDFDGTNGGNSKGSLMEAANGKLYGMTYFGGVNNKGVLFEYDPTTNTYTKKIDFDGTTNGQYPYGSLMEAANGKLYGMINGGGVNYAGVLFEYDPTTNTYTNKLDFDGTTNGAYPQGSLMEATNGKLYGMTYGGGVNSKGVLFEYDPTTNTYTKKLDFDGTTNGQSPQGSLIEISSCVSTNSSFTVADCNSYITPSGNTVTSSQTINDTIPNACGADSVMTITVIIGASTKTVTNINNAGAGSLRQTVIDACPGDTIRFAASLLTAAVDSISLTTEIAFSKSLIFKGLYTATDTLFISGANNSRIFNISNAGKVVMDSMVLVNGFADTDAGGAIFSLSSSDTLHILNTTIANNTATYKGGGIYTTTTPVIISNSLLSNNISNSSSGGGISCNNNSPLIVSNSTIANNSASSGGGINCTSNSPLTLSNSTVANNSASNNGGGIYSSNNSPITITNSTITNNSAAFYEGIHTTINSNLTLTSSIVAENGIGAHGILANTTSNGYNIFSGSFSSAIATDQTNITAAQLNLQALANNGGSTPTMLPGAGSLAIDYGNPLDATNAQNGSITGIRDAGAAETCTVLTIDSQTVCGGLTWLDGITYTTNTDTAIFNYPNGAATGCDSLVRLNLSAVSIPIAQTIIQANDTVCYGDSTSITITSSELGVTYTLIDTATTTVVDGPTAGTGSSIVFSTGALNIVKSYFVKATKGTCPINLDTITVYIDAIAPIITCPANQIVAKDANCQVTLADYTGLAVVTDNCTATPTVTQLPIATTVLNNDTTVWIYATDAAGNVDSCSFIVTLADSTAPAITCPGAQTVAGSASCDAVLADYTSMAVVTDNCDANPVVTQSPATGATISGATTTVWLYATDVTGNVDSCSFVVNISDVIAPVITCPATQTVATDANCDGALADYTGMATVTDNCDASPVVTQSPAIGTTINTATTVWLYATDVAGNVDSCSFMVTLIDVLSPVITCPTTQTIIGDANCDAVLADYTGMATVTDNCDANPTVTQSPAIGAIVNGLSNTVWLYATDVAGNVDSCSFTVVTSDTIAPVITCLPNQTEYLDVNCEVSLPDYGVMMTTTDNCDASLTVTQTPEAGTIYTSEQEVVVEVIFTDAAGNASSCEFTTTVGLDASSGCGGELVIFTLLTPNGDGKNDTWIIQEAQEIKNCSVMVFNRWGQKVYESTGYDNSWNGTSNGADLPDGAYYYVISCADDVNYTGPITILRTNK